MFPMIMLLYQNIFYPLLSRVHVLITFYCYRIVKATSPYLNIFIIIGVIIIYADVVLFGIDGRVTSDTVLKVTCNVCNNYMHS